MQRLRIPGLLDSGGQPLPAHIEQALLELIPRLQRQFPTFRDEAILVEMIEEAGRRVARREARSGRIQSLYGYTWVTLRSVATSKIRRHAHRHTHSAGDLPDGAKPLASIAATSGTPEEIERRILVRELLETLSQEERLICAWKTEGHSSLEIAQRLGRRATAIDEAFARAKRKIRTALGLGRAAASKRASRPRPRHSSVTTPESKRNTSSAASSTRTDYNIATDGDTSTDSAPDAAR